MLRDLDFHLPPTEAMRQIPIKSVFNECLVSGQGSNLESWLFLPWSLSCKGQKESISRLFSNKEPSATVFFFSHWKTYAYVIFVIAENKAECGEESGIIHWHSQPTGANCLLWFPVLSILSSCLGQPAHCSTLEQWIRSSKVHTWPTGLFCLGLFLIHWEKSNAWSAEQFLWGRDKTNWRFV